MSEINIPAFKTGPDLAALRQQAGLTLDALATAAGYSAALIRIMEGQDYPLKGIAMGKLRTILEGRISIMSVIAKKPAKPDAPPALPVTPHETLVIVEVRRPTARVSNWLGPCAATTRAGTPCKQKAVYRNGRSKLHGGLSTGPKTADGIERIREGQRRRRQHEAEHSIEM